MQFELIEPLNTLYKDEVRALGTELGMPDEIVWRQPFPGPGLAIRVMGEITKEKLETDRESDAILREEIAKAGLDRDIWQYFTVNTGVRSVGVMGDGRTYDYTSSTAISRTSALSSAARIAGRRRGCRGSTRTRTSAPRTRPTRGSWTRLSTVRTLLVSTRIAMRSGPC